MVEIVLAANGEYDEPQLQHGRAGLQVPQEGFMSRDCRGERVRRLTERREGAAERNPVSSPERRSEIGHAGGIAARTIEAFDKSSLDRIDGGHEDNRDCGRGSLRRKRAVGRASDDRQTFAPNQIGRQCLKPLGVTIRPAIFDRDILAFDVASFTQTSA